MRRSDEGIPRMLVAMYLVVVVVLLVCIHYWSHAAEWPRVLGECRGGHALQAAWLKEQEDREGGASPLVVEADGNGLVTAMGVCAAGVGSGPAGFDLQVWAMAVDTRGLLDEYAVTRDPDSLQLAKYALAECVRVASGPPLGGGAAPMDAELARYCAGMR